MGMSHEDTVLGEKTEVSPRGIANEDYASIKDLPVPSFYRSTGGLCSIMVDSGVIAWLGSPPGWAIGQFVGV